VRRASGSGGGALEAAEGGAEGGLGALEHGDLAGGPQAVGAKAGDRGRGRRRGWRGRRGPRPSARRKFGGRGSGAVTGGRSGSPGRLGGSRRPRGGELISSVVRWAAGARCGEGAVWRFGGCGALRACGGRTRGCGASVMLAGDEVLDRGGVAGCLALLGWPGAGVGAGASGGAGAAAARGGKAAAFEYRVGMDDPERHEFQVELSFRGHPGAERGPAAAEVEPGAYRLTEAHRNVRGVVAETPAGSRCRWSRSTRSRGG
jgi:hypothetical protein